MTMLNKWFSRRRSSAIGWANVVSRFGALVLVPAAAWAVAPGRIGWQMTALIIGVCILIMAGPLAALLRNDPKDYGEVPDGRAARPLSAPGGTATASGPRQQDLTAAEAMRTPAFWLIAFGHGFTSMVILAIMTHIGLLMVDKGYTTQDAGWVVSAYTGVAMVFQLVGGYSGDRMSKRVGLAFFTSVQASGVLILVIAQTLPMFFVFAVLFGAGFGGAQPAHGGNPGRLLRHGLFRQDTGILNCPHEPVAADSPPPLPVGCTTNTVLIPWHSSYWLD